jgi:hypothetical protein
MFRCTIFSLQRSILLCSQQLGYISRVFPERNILVALGNHRSHLMVATAIADFNQVK